jgi:hypothetical protein
MIAQTLTAHLREIMQLQASPGCQVLRNPRWLATGLVLLVQPILVLAYLARLGAIVTGSVGLAGDPNPAVA